MDHTGLETLIDDDVRPIDCAPPFIRSAPDSCSGFLLEQNICRDGYAKRVVFPYTELILVSAGSICLEYRAHDVSNRFFARLDSVTIWPAGSELKSVAWTAPRLGHVATELIKVRLNIATLERLAPEQAAVISMPSVPQSAVADPVLAAIMRLMAADVAAGCPSGRLYGDSLSLALAVHVAGRYATTPMTRPPRGILARPILRRVLAYIRTNLGRQLTITELAALAHMSPGHFSSCFKNAVGVAPHQWVMHARVREAKRLLKTQRMSITEIALDLGFASQSHFTEVFRRRTGSTPRRYRRHG